MAFSDKFDFIDSVTLTEISHETVRKVPRYVFTEGHMQYPQKFINVWAGILGETIIGHLVIKGNLNVVTYADMLQGP